MCLKQEKMLYQRRPRHGMGLPSGRLKSWPKQPFCKQVSEGLIRDVENGMVEVVTKTLLQHIHRDDGITHRAKLIDGWVV